MTTPKKPRTKLKPFRAWALVNEFGQSGWAIFRTKRTATTHRCWWQRVVGVLCTPVAPRKRKGKRK